MRGVIKDKGLCTPGCRERDSPTTQRPVFSGLLVFFLFGKLVVVSNEERREGGVFRKFFPCCLFPHKGTDGAEMKKQDYFGPDPDAAGRPTVTSWP